MNAYEAFHNHHQRSRSEVATPAMLLMVFVVLRMAAPKVALAVLMALTALMVLTALH